MAQYADYTQFGKEIKHRLIDIGMTNTELCEKVAVSCGKYFDDSQLSRICRGKIGPSMTVYIDSIKEILSIEDTA